MLSTDKFYEILNTTWDTGPLQTAEAKKMRSKNPDLAYKQGYYAALSDLLEQFDIYGIFHGRKHLCCAYSAPRS